MLYTIVIYRNEKEIDRWSPVERGPQPKHFLQGDLMMTKSVTTGKTLWYKHSWSEWYIEHDYLIPKRLRLLALLE